VGHAGPYYAVSKRVLAKLSEVKLNDMKWIVVFEYLSPSKIRSIPNGTMAFHRTGKTTALIILQWDNTIHDCSQEAREIAQEIAGSMLGDHSLLHDPSWFGYGNYGEHPGQGNDQSECSL
jgi:hypothetical protein